MLSLVMKEFFENNVDGNFNIKSLSAYLDKGDLYFNLYCETKYSKTPFTLKVIFEDNTVRVLNKWEDI